MTADLFNDGKEGGALRTIGEVARALGVKAHVLRYWEEQFPSLKPLKRSGGRRYYRPEDVAMLQRISRLLTQEGYTIRGARAALEGSPVVSADVPPAPPVAGPIDRAMLVERLHTIRARLLEAMG